MTVDITACIMWEKVTDPDGYGRAWHNGKVELAHRVAYCVANNLPLSAISGKVIRHSCDTPGCVNPHHLSEGGHQDNMDDKVKRGRANQPKRRALPDEAVHAIRASGLSRAKLAAQYGVSSTCIQQIKLRITYKEV